MKINRSKLWSVSGYCSSRGALQALYKTFGRDLDTVTMGARGVPQV